MSSLAGIMADFAIDLDFTHLPAPVVATAKSRILDALGVGLAAASLTVRPRLEDAVRALGRGREATALGLAQLLPAPSAALLNGSHIHALEFDDTHMAAVIHGSAVLLPTALAMAEREGATGPDLLAALVAGWEVIARIGLAGPGIFQARGFQSTAIAGTLVAALVAARLMALDRAQTMAAMGIAGSQAAGLFEFLANGATVKMLHGGWPGHAGIMAAELARAGMTGPLTVFEGGRGVFRAYAGDGAAGERLRAALGDLGRNWLLPQVATKAYPCCHYIQPFLECAETLAAMGVTADAIVALECVGPAEVAWLIAEPWAAKLAPASGHVAKFSLPYCVAAMLVEGAVDVTTFDRLEPDLRLSPVMGRIAWRAMAESGFPDRYPGRLVARLASGEVREAAVADVRGSPSRPFQPAEIEAKFRRNAARILTAAGVEGVVRAVEQLDETTDLQALGSALRSLGA